MASRKSNSDTGLTSSKGTSAVNKAVLTEQNRPPTASSNGMHERNAARAYALHEERGYRHGCDLQDWVDAEREILSRQLPT
ncbi:MAG: DUF2934 domain-containing protein [Nitrospira sp.]|nr:DUF2934 domain-containing protein [Nitrospira sp.]